MLDQSERALRVQIVEDEGIVALDLRHGLEQLGFDVVGIAANEMDAVRLALATVPDLVLMDIHLDQGSDGISAAQKIRQQLAVPVVFLSAFGEAETLQRAAEAAPYGYLLKPFELRELNATVRMAVVRRTEERKTEQAQRRLRLALESARLVVLEMDDGSPELRWSGMSPSHELGQIGEALQLSGLLQGLDALGRQGFEALLQRGDPLDLVCRWQAGEQAERWLELHARRFDEEKLVMGMVRDVSIRVERDTRLRQAMVVFDATDEAILFLDAQRRVISCNPAFCRLTGWTEAEVRGLQPQGFLYARRHGDQVQGEMHSHGEVMCRRADASLFPALEHLCAVVDGEGTVTHHVLSFSDISEIRNTQFKLRHQALHDPLTGLANRMQLHETLQERTQRSAAASKPFGLLFIDLDGFKGINDTLGHDRGDELLITMSRRLQAALRSEDLAVRLGGDEFVVLMGLSAPTGGMAAGATMLSQKLLDAISQPVQLGAQSLSLTASVGIALYPEHGADPHALLKAADAAMYEAKARGRNRLALFAPMLAEAVAVQHRMEQGLRRALENRELSLHWQPMVDMRDGSLRGAEVLLRWQHPELGQVPPNSFIPLAETTGMICPIGNWVLDQACEQLAAWRQQGLLLPRVAINVSVRQFEQEDMLHRVHRTLQRCGIAPEQLEIEVTESLFANGVAMRQVLDSLRDLGVRISMDDFGTGFSSLGQLKSLPLDRMKIDRSFVSDLERDASSRAIVHTIITLARSLGLDITAEGVETDAQRQTLLSMGAHEAQGWLFHRALSAAQMQALLASRVG